MRKTGKEQHTVCKCANEIEAFRYHFLYGKVVVFDKIDTNDNHGIAKYLKQIYDI